jgi:fatty-acyl-CoA synthase
LTTTSSQPAASTTASPSATAAGLTDLVTQARANALGNVLRRSAARHGAKTALIDGARQFSYAEFDAAVDAVASSLQRSGIAAGDRVALLSRNCWEFAALAWGCARLGAVLVPVNFMLTADEVAFLLDDAEIAAFFAGADLLGTAADALARSGAGATLRVAVRSDEPPPGWESFDAWLQPAPAGWAAPPVEDDAVIRIMYTSGTESRPKGAMLSSRALLAEYVSCVIEGGMTPDDIDLHTLPLYHCAQLDCFLGPDLMLGATSVLLPGPDPSAVLAAIERHGVTKYFAPPTVWISLLRSPAFDGCDKSSLRKGYYGASPMPIEVLRELLARLPDVSLWNFYGQTEIAPLATILPPHEQVPSAGSAGWPVLNVQTLVVDDDDQPVPPGQVGEVVHRTPQATLGYWRNPEKTAEAFRSGWFHSGDLGVFDDEGRLTIVDRKKDMIKTGGENVASREVEEAIYAHPAVAEVAVFATPDDKWVEAVTAAVVIRAGQTVDAAALTAHCRGLLAPFKCPKRIEIVDALPKNPSGKILKRDLRTRFSTS